MYLRGVKGDCSNQAGPGNCGRISCSWNSGIWWCNDNLVTYTRPCSYFADYVDILNMQCRWDLNHGSGDKLYMISGQIFDSDNFNVIIARHEFC
jgi:hypothetical protein